ncbi:MAG: FAD-dependent oxidoreductase [Pirellulales bacterium]
MSLSSEPGTPVRKQPLRAAVRAETVLLIVNLDTVGSMSCNPAIGGAPAKTDRKSEIDAMGWHRWPSDRSHWVSSFACLHLAQRGCWRAQPRRR